MEDGGNDRNPAEDTGVTETTSLNFTFADASTNKS